ncbi:MAG: sensor histidine kinase [Anaerolineales bacterium]|jgi:two-component system sensor histidine kinase DegS|nr:sensor histidine kinase [Anaerolineales bacterium]
MPNAEGITNPLEEARNNIQTVLDESGRSLHEVTLMIEQSQVEVGKLTQRNAAITAHLQQVQAQGNAADIEEVRMAYASALDAQQRLFVMRGQLEKLQSDQSHLEQYSTSLKEVLILLQSRDINASPGPSQKTQPAGMEMIIQAQEAERQRLSRQMHDGPAQALSNFILQTEIAMRLMDIDVAQAREELSSLKASAMGTFQKVRNFIFELRPMMLDDLGLVPTIKRYVDSFKEQNSLDVTLTVTGQERRLESYLEVMVFRAVQELLGNAARHSQASQVKTQLDINESAIKVVVDDNGKGFSAEVLEQGNSLGLGLIRERVEMLGGSFELSTTVGKGTRIIFSLPAQVV